MTQKSLMKIGIAVAVLGVGASIYSSQNLTQSSQGEGSPNVGNVGGNVSINNN